MLHLTTSPFLQSDRKLHMESRERKRDRLPLIGKLLKAGRETSCNKQQELQSATANSPAPPSVTAISHKAASRPTTSGSVLATPRAPPSSAAPTTADTAQPSLSQQGVPVARGGDGTAEASEGMSLWEQACSSLRQSKSKHLALLEENFETLENKDSISGNIAQIVNTKQAQLRAKDCVSKSKTQKALSRSTRFIISTKDAGMGLARLDPHGIAPIVLGGVYTLVQIIQGGSDESQTAMSITLESAELVALWTTIEERQISTNRNPNLNELYKELGMAILKLYKVITVLLGTMMGYFDRGRWASILGTLVPNQSEWKGLQTDINSLDSNCNKIKGRITIEKEKQERERKILKWLCPDYDIRGSLKGVLERTGVDDQYSDRCQWLVNHNNFERWYTPGTNSVLWLTGTIGTGKTTAMARAICEMQKSLMIKINLMPLAIFFFQKGSKQISTVTCLRSLVRQLSWNNETEEIEPSVRDKYAECENQRSDDSSLTLKECCSLLTQLRAKRETYIMIDGIDECDDPNNLLDLLHDLITPTTEDANKVKPLHLMLCGRKDLTISDFIDCYIIETSSIEAAEDEAFYIDSEIDSLCQKRTRSEFSKSEKGFPSRLKLILKEKSGGLFRWTEIQIEKFKIAKFRTEDEIQHELDHLERHTALDTLNEEYKRLLDDLKYDSSRERVMKMLKLVACSFVELTVEDLAEAINASEHDGGRERSQLTSENVRRLLVGFISEREAQVKRWSYETRRWYTTENPIVVLAHSSVLEYLMGKHPFSLLDQNSEAALLCFSRISVEVGERRGGKLKVTFPDFDEDDERFRPSYNNLSRFLKYSCDQWPLHCRRAFDQDGKCPLIGNTADFILKNAPAFKIWNDLVRYSGHSMSFLTESTWQRGPLPKPSFVIALHNLTELLEIAEVQDLIDLRDVNGVGKSLLLYSMHFSDRAICKRLVQLHPEQVIPDEDGTTLKHAAESGAVDVVEKLFENGADIQKGSASALHFAVIKMGRLLASPEKAEAYVKIIRILLDKGANIFEPVDRGQLSIHFAARPYNPELLSIFLQHAGMLEKQGLRGSVQRLLRFRDGYGRTPGDCALEHGALVLHDQFSRQGKNLNVQWILDLRKLGGRFPGKVVTGAEYLEKQLTEAERHDGGVLYEFDHPIVEEMQKRREDKGREAVDSWEFFSLTSFEDQVGDEAAMKYSDWYRDRRQKLDEQYKNNERKIKGLDVGGS